MYQIDKEKFHSDLSQLIFKEIEKWCGTSARSTYKFVLDSNTPSHSCYMGQVPAANITVTIFFFILPLTEYLQRPRTSSLEKILARRRSINNKNIPDAGDQKTILDFTVQVRALSFGVR